MVNSDNFVDSRYFTSSGIPINRVYIPNELDEKYMSKLGFPGYFPYTRGIYPSMYRKRTWTLRQYAGFGSARHTNERFRYLLDKGQTALSVAFDLPTQIGYDSDHPLAIGEVGKVGVAIDTLRDMEILFDSIPLERISTSMTINAPAVVLLCMYIATAENNGIDPSKLSGTIQNDVLKEYTARGTYIFPPEQSVRLTTNIIQYCKKNLPKMNPISISGYHMREAGATAIQEIAFTFANAFTYIDHAINNNLKIDDFAPRLSFFFSSHIDFFEEVAKFRAARRIWARLIKEKYKAKNENSLKLRFHTQTAGSTLSSKEPMNNITRVTLQAMAAVLGGTQSLHTNSWDEAISLPNEEAAKLALRTQQIIATESGVTKTVDPLGGSYYVESLTDEIEKKIVLLLEEVELIGGALKAILSGYINRKIQHSAYEAFKTASAFEMETDIDEKKENYDQVDQEITRVTFIQKEEISKIKQTRNTFEVDRCLINLNRAASAHDVNIVPYVLDAVKSYCTIGEICDVFREVFGEYEGFQL